ncbi:MAG TPA: glycine cleavage system aminomethyltransferase GcvT [Acidimicrobiia bacterium]|nr:glycine cleavage system aminomethyltransferase GcvT [Acidimicrobiia bacterium]
MTSRPARRSPLHDLHAGLGARFVDFGGWDMPVQYEGTLAEHHAVRSSCGVFDVTHLGRFHMAGPGATATLRDLLCNDVTAIEPGRCQYTMMLTEAGGVVDDIIVWRLGDEEHVVLPNGVNHARVLAATAEAAPDGVRFDDIREHTVLLAVQGPDAPALLESVLGWRPRRFRADRFTWEDVEIVGAGTGYTGERGGELVVPVEAGAAVFEALREAGAVACGLGARDTLRLEMGYALWGQDLDDDTTPLEAGLGWVVDWDHDFVGRAALEHQRATGVPRSLVGFVFDGRTIPRHGYAARSGDSTGTVASGNFSPSLEVGIGLAYLTPPPDGSDPVEVDIRGRWVEARRADPPFLER